MKILVVPDSQNGFVGSRPLHDGWAWECVFRAAKAGRFDRIVLLGDMLDLAPFGKYRVSQALKDTTQRTFDDMRAKLTRLRRENRNVPIDWLEGNHEARWQNAFTDRLAEAATVNDLSLPVVLGLEKLGVTWHGPYGARIEYDNVIYTHGDKHGAWGGQTSAKYLAKATTKSFVFGHSHKSEIAWRKTDDGELFAMCPGTISHVDGRVPGTTMHPDWTQGLAIVEDGWPELCPISKDGVRVRGRWL